MGIAISARYNGVGISITIGELTDAITERDDQALADVIAGMTGGKVKLNPERSRKLLRKAKRESVSDESVDIAKAVLKALGITISAVV